MIVDQFGRQFRNLRLSLTAACNYACTYCVPDGKRLLAASSELSAQQMIRALKLLIDTAGIDKLRITGGEPLLSPKFDELLPAITQMGLSDISITTNGQLVPRKARLIIDSGIQRINLSLDTLNAEKFRSIARSGDLATVLRGIEILQEAGIRLKINMVPMRNQNHDQILPLLEYCLSRNIELRFIELMNMGHLQGSPLYRQQFFGMHDILGQIAQNYEYVRTDAPFDSTAVRFEIPGRGFFGIIANESEPFCKSCTRIRLSSNGELYGCLSSAKSYPMTQLLELPNPIAMAKLQDVLYGALADKQTLGFSGEVTVMKFIGG